MNMRTEGRGRLGRRVRVQGVRGYWKVKSITRKSGSGIEVFILQSIGRPPRLKRYALREEIIFERGDYTVPAEPGVVVVRSSRGI